MPRGIYARSGYIMMDTIARNHTEKIFSQNKLKVFFQIMKKNYEDCCAFLCCASHPSTNKSQVQTSVFTLFPLANLAKRVSAQVIIYKTRLNGRRRMIFIIIKHYYIILLNYYYYFYICAPPRSTAPVVFWQAGRARRNVRGIPSLQGVGSDETCTPG